MNERVRILWKERSKKSSAAAKTKGEGSRRTEEGGGYRRGHLIGFTCDGEVSIEYCVARDTKHNSKDL